MQQNTRTPERDAMVATSVTLFNEKPHREAYTVRRFLLIGVIALLNVVILAAFGAYFSGERLGLLDIIDMVSDSFGTVTGLLGVWFFFLSERLNRSTTSNMEQIKATVNDLHKEMWQIIRQSVTQLSTQQNKEETSEVRQALDEFSQRLKTEEEITKSELIELTATLKKSIEDIERNYNNAFVTKIDSLTGYIPTFPREEKYSMSPSETNYFARIIGEVFNGKSEMRSNDLFLDFARRTKTSGKQAAKMLQYLSENKYLISTPVPITSLSLHF